MSARRLSVLLLAAASLSSPVSAQQIHLTRKGGTLGDSLQITIQGTKHPTQFFLMVPSTNKGPTPLRFIDPRDPRELGIGMEFALIFNVFGPMSALPFVGALPVANVPSLHGTTFYWQAFTFLGDPWTIGSLSNRITTSVGAVNSWLDRGVKAEFPHSLGTVTDIGNGDLLVAGGFDKTTGAFSKGSSATEFWMGDDQEFLKGRTMLQSRVLHTATLVDSIFPKSQILFTGGANALGAVTNTCEVYDISTSAFIAVRAMGNLRAGHTATVLPNKKVLVTGGTTKLDTQLNVTAGLLNSTELYDPVLKTWTAGPNMFTLRAGHSAVLLADGRVLLSGGLSRDALGKPVTTTSCEIYDPRTNTMVRTASLPTAGTLGHRSTRLQDGTVLLCGGFSVNQNIATGLTEATAFVYDPTFAKWASVARMTQLRAFHGQALLPNGKVLVAGGVTSTGLNYVTVDSCELYDPGLKSWAPAGKLGTTRAFAQTLLLDTGQVVVIGGTSGNPSLNAVLTSTELFFSSLR